MRTRESHACLDGKHRGRLFVSLSLSLFLTTVRPPPRATRAARRAASSSSSEDIAERARESGERSG